MVGTEGRNFWNIGVMKRTKIAFQNYCCPFYFVMVSFKKDVTAKKTISGLPPSLVTICHQFH